MTVIRVDERAVRQMLLNLLSNAMKFSQRGDPVHISAGIEAGNLRVTVSDKGTGMSERTLNSVTEPFVQGTLGSFDEGGPALVLRLPNV